MSAVPPSLLAPRSPQVNLIPPEVASRRAAGKTRGMILLLLVGFALILGAASFAVDSQKRSAESKLALAQAQGAALQTEIDKYAEVPLVQKELENAIGARLFAGATEVRWQELLLRVRAVMPSGVSMATLSFTNTSVADLSAPVPRPFATAGIGTLSFNARSAQYPDVASLERAINSVRGLTDAHIPTVTRVVTEGVISYTFSGTATVSAEALDLRFTDAWFVTRNRELADEYLDVYVSVAEARLTAAKASVAAGTAGAAADLTGAQEDRDAAVDAREIFNGLAEALGVAGADLATATNALTNGEAGAEAAVAASQAKVDALGAGLDQFSAAAVASRDASVALYVASTRVAAAEAQVAAKKAQLTSAQAALASATTNRAALQADVEYYTSLVSEAEAVLTKETDAVAAATAAALSARDALIQATSVAQTVLATADVAVAPKPQGTPTAGPSPSPTGVGPSASASPTTTQGSGG